LSRLYGLLQALDRFRYSLIKPWKASVPIISVGNLVAGGTGKTVLVDYLIEKFSKQKKVAVACRGYRAHEDGFNDEMRLLKRHYPDLIIQANPERRKAIEACIKEGAEVVFLDDGFQHRKVARDLDLVILDASDPYSRDLLPLGRRREPISSLARADILILSHANCLEANDLENLKETLGKNFNKPVLSGFHCLKNPKNAEGQELEKGPVHLLAGIGKPQHFEAGLKALGYEVKQKTLPGDHLAPAATALESLESSELPVVCTEKDIVKQSKARTWYVAEVKWEFLKDEGEDVLIKKIEDVFNA
jgi:tetraacyldisaccharide 4'-kinase